MKVSCRKGDKDYKPEAIFNKIYLDGEQLMQCFFADDKKGEAHCWKTNLKGDFVFDKENKDVETIVLKGNVKIELPQEM